MTTISKRVALVTASAAFLALGTAEVSQAFTVYNDRASFSSAVGSLSTIGFEGIAPTGGFTNFGSTGLTQSGVTFSGVSPVGNGDPAQNGNAAGSVGAVAGLTNYLFVVDPAYNPPGYDWGSGAVLLGGLRGTINVTLPAGINVIGTDFSTILPYASDLVVSLSTGNSVTVSALNYPNRAFVGFVSEIPISSIAFTARNGYPQLDNFTFGQRVVEQSVPVPTPALLPGLFGLGFAAWRKRKGAVSE